METRIHYAKTADGVSIAFWTLAAVPLMSVGEGGTRSGLSAEHVRYLARTGVVKGQKIGPVCAVSK